MKILQKPLLSIVIPTKNRYETLLPTLEAILKNIDDARLEIVVQDNSDDPGVAITFLSEYKEPRINYAHVAGSLSIVENTEVALSRANGEYITFIGDDDFVSPYIVKFVEDFARRRIVAVTYPSAYYWWKSVKFQTLTRFHQPGAFWYPHHTGTNEHIINTTKELSYVLAQGAVGLFDLPRIYHGIVHRSVLDKIKAKSKRFVSGASPDMALAIAASLVIDSHIKINIPLTVYGASKNSGGGWTASKTHFGKIADQPHLPQSTKDNWNNNLPLIWSEFTIYPQTAMEVLSAFGRADTINYAAFYASMIICEPYLIQSIAPVAVRFFRRHPQSTFKFLVVAAKKLVGRLRRELRLRVFGINFELHMFDSSDICMKHLLNKYGSE